MKEFILRQANVVPASELRGEDSEETEELYQLLSEATHFVTSFRWCTTLQEKYFGYGVGGVLGIFLFRIAPDGPDADEWIWVLVGDMPPAYISTEGNRFPKSALNAYLIEMKRWVDAVEGGRSTEGLIPVDVPSTLEFAAKLRGRLDFLEREILPKVPGSDDGN